MSGTEQAPGAVLANWQPDEIVFVLELTYRAALGDNEDEDEETCDACVTLRALAQPKARGVSPWPDPGGDWFEVRLRFVGVRELRMDRFGPGPQQIMGFSVVDYADRGWEGVRYKIEDYEDNRLSFYCRELAIESRTRLQRKPEFLRALAAGV